MTDVSQRRAHLGLKTKGGGGLLTANATTAATTTTTTTNTTTTEDASRGTAATPFLA